MTSETGDRLVERQAGARIDLQRSRSFGGISLDVRDLAVADEFDVVRKIHVPQIAHVRRLSETLALDEVPDRWVRRAEDPDGDAAETVVLCHEPLVCRRHSIEEPHLMLLALVIDVPKCRIQGII